MKKTTITLAVICCIATIISGISIAYAYDANKMVEDHEENFANIYGDQYIDSEFEKIREEIDLSEYNYPLGENTYWYPAPVRQAQVEISGNTLTIPAKKHIKVVFAENMSISPDNEDFEKDRTYTFIDPNEDAYLIVAGTETGVAIINVIKH